MQLKQRRSIMQNLMSQSSEYSRFVALGRSVVLDPQSGYFDRFFLSFLQSPCQLCVVPQIMLVPAWINKPEISTHKYILNNARKVCLTYCLAMQRYAKSDVRSAKAFVCDRGINPPEAPLYPSNRTSFCCVMQQLLSAQLCTYILPILRNFKYRACS
jgi:hypothetical protein